MPLSLITPSRNSSKTLEQTIQSVLNQQGVEPEYIIVDGGSTDGTPDIIKQYQAKYFNIKFISEPDQGLYDAMNKGIKLATGEIIGIINSDDFYFNENVLQAVVDAFEKNNIDACYGDIAYVAQDDIKKITRYWRAGEYQENKLNYGWIPPHPAFFVKKDVYQKFGLFNLDFKIAADYEFMLRVIKNNIKLYYLKKPLVYMREGGASAKNIQQRIKGWQELRRAWKVNGLKPPLFFFITRPLFKVYQYFIKK